MLWAIIWVAGNIAGAAGPLPRTMAECQEVVRLQNQDWDKAWAEKHLDRSPVMVLNGRRLKRGDFRMTCEYREKRPSIKDPVRLP